MTASNKTSPQSVQDMHKLSASEPRKCLCDWCVRWGPLTKRISDGLEESDKAEFEEFMLMYATQSDDLGAAEAKLAGDWPGWEWMKGYKPA